MKNKSFYSLDPFTASAAIAKIKSSFSIFGVNPDYVSDAAIEDKIFHRLFDADGNMIETEQEIRDRIEKYARKNIKDAGTCVLGMKLRYIGRTIAEQMWQGSSSNYEYFQLVKSELIKYLGYENENFQLEHGVMD